MRRLLVAAGALAGGAWVSLQAWQQPAVRGPLEPAGLASVRGTVLSDDTPARPLRRAVVTASGAGLPLSRSVITDGEGRFAIEGLSAGRLTVTASRPGYLPGSYGARRPGRPGTALVLAPGDRREIAISLTHGAVLTGTIRDDRGAPATGLRVFAINALRPASPQPVPIGERSGVDNRGVVTDDRGVYRLYGLSPGDYFVAAVPPSVRASKIGARSTKEMDTLLSALERRRAAQGMPVVQPTPLAESTRELTVAPTFYPGTFAMADAGRIRLAAGEVREALDFVTTTVPVTTITGMVTNPDGPLPADVELSVAPSHTLQFFALATSAPLLVRRPGADGLFEFSAVTPGPYVIRARGRRSAVPTAPAARGVPAGSRASGSGRGADVAEPRRDLLYAIESLDVAGTPIAGLTLSLQPASEFRGRVAFEGQGARPADLSSVRVNVQPAVRAGMSVRETIVGSNFTEARSASVLSDGTFTITGLAPGGYLVYATVDGGPAAGGDWWLRSAVVDGRDVLDATLDVRLGADVAGAVLTMTDRRTALSGSLQTSSGLPAVEYFVVVFPADPALRTSGSRRVKFTRPASDGSYSFIDVPAGDYRLVALTDLEPDVWNSPEFLGAIADEGVAVRVDQARGARQDLRVLESPTGKP